MKKVIAFILASVILCTGAYVPVFAEGDAEWCNAVWSYNGVARAEELVSVMVMDISADINNPDKNDLKRIEVVRADENGKFELSFPLEDVCLDKNGRITNMKLNSNIEGLTLSAGTLSNKVRTLWEITDVYEENGVPYVPLVSTFAELGVTMTETSSGVFEGFGKNGPILIEIGKDTAEVDWVDIEMPAKSKYVNDIAMIPAYILEDAAYTEPVEYDKGGKSVKIKIKSGNGLYKSYDNAIDYESVLATLPKGKEIANASDFLNKLRVGAGGNLVAISTVSVEGESFEKAKRIVTKPYSYTEPAAGDIQLMLSVPYKIKTGEVSLVSFKARTLETEDGSDEASLGVQHQRYSDWAKALSKTVSVKKGEWQQFYLPVYSAYNEMPEGSPLTLSVGGMAKTIEIADFSFVTYGTEISADVLIPTDSDGYKGIEEDALWRKEAKRRIEKYRKGDALVKVFDENGNAVKDAKIKVNQTENEFMFGLAIMSGELPDPADNSTVDKQITNELIDSTMNTLVPADLMRPAYIHNDDGTKSIEMVNKIISRGKRLRGHFLMWDSRSRAWPFDNAYNISYEELYRQTADYVLPTAYAFRGKMEQWDLLNEPVQSNYLRKKYGTRLYSDISKEVHNIDPDVKLYINEQGIVGLNKKTDRDGATDVLIDIVRQMKAEGAHIDGIGIQGHFGSYSYPQGFYKQLDRCANEVDEISVTEYDIKNENETLADEHLRDTLLATFSHPKAKAFVVWEYWDKRHWNSSAPFYNDDWSEKPAKAVWDKMINNDFKTRTEVISDQNGNAGFRGFYGDYEITAEVNGKTITFPFKLRSDGANSIDIRVSDTITYNVSAEPDTGKSLIEYKSVAEAGSELAEGKPFKYDGIVLESNFRNAEPFADTASDEFLNGDAWGSKSGLAKCVSFNNSGADITAYAASCDLRKRIQGRVWEDTDLSFECMFSTYGLRDADTRAELAFDTEDGAYAISIGKIVSAQNGYYFETQDGNRFELRDNTDYNLIVGLKDCGGNNFDAEYKIYCGGELAESSETAERIELNAADIAGAVFKFYSEGTSGAPAFNLRNVRVKYSTAEDIIRFSDIGCQKYLLCDLLSDFDSSAVTCDSADEGYLNGELWLASSGNYARAFGSHKYKWSSKYLWSIRNDGGIGTQTLKKMFKPVKDGKNIRAEFDIFCNAPGGWYNTPGEAGIRLCSSDGSVKTGIFRYYYDRYHGANLFALNAKSLSDNYMVSENGRYWVNNDDVTDLNRNTLNAVFELSLNKDGKYDARLTVKNNMGNTVIDYSVNDYISSEEIKKLDNIELFSYTSPESGTSYGDIVCGVKNLVISQTAGTLRKDSEGNILLQDDDRIEIDYENITGRSFDATLMVGAYKDGALTAVRKKDITVPKIKAGGIGVNIEDVGADFYKVFLLRNTESLTPLTAGSTVLK